MASHGCDALPRMKEKGVPRTARMLAWNLQPNAWVAVSVTVLSQVREKGLPVLRLAGRLDVLLNMSCTELLLSKYINL
jgi:hypothetical protein